MPVQGEFFQNPGGDSQFYSHQINQSVRFSSSGTTYLSRTQGTPTNVDKMTVSFWVKRGKLGAVSNRLTSTMANLDQVAVNLSASQGRIQDADFAAETSNLAKSQSLQQAATAMLAQANASKGNVLSLIQS